MREGSGGGRSERSERSARRAQSARRARCARTIAATEFHVAMRRKMHTNVSMCLVKYNGIISTQNGIIKFPQQKRRDNFMKERTPKRDNYFAEAKRRDNFATLFRQYNTNARSRGVANGNYPVPCTTGSLAFDRILRGQRGCVVLLRGQRGCVVLMAGWSASYGSKAGALCSWPAGVPAFLLEISRPELPHRLYSL